MLQVEDMSRKISVVFRVLVLTVPSQYLVAFFTFWQFRVTQLDTVMGIIMLVVQVKITWQLINLLLGSKAMLWSWTLRLANHL
jgi:hypothetical protein